MCKILLPPTTHREGLPRVGSLPCAPTYYSRGVVLQHVRGLQTFRACATTQMQLADRNVPFKQCYASGLQQHHLICNEDIVVKCLLLVVRRALQIKPTDNIYDFLLGKFAIVSSPSSNSRTSANLIDLLAASICCHRGRPRCNAVIVLIMLSPSHTRFVFEGRFELLRQSVRGTPSRNNYGPTFYDQLFSDSLFLRFSKVLDRLNCSSENSPSAGKKCPANVFFCPISYMVCDDHVSEKQSC